MTLHLLPVALVAFPGALQPQQLPQSQQLLQADRSESWCPGRCPVGNVTELLIRANLSWATEFDHDLSNSRCDLCGTRWLFVVSFGGRTGSTSLLNMLNSHPALAIAGENGGQLGKGMALWEQAATLGSGLHGHDQLQAFSRSSPVQPAKLLCDVVDYMVDTSALAAQREDQKVLGFKEIRWESPGDDSNYLRLIKFIEAVFPCHRIIFNDREAESMNQSNTWFHTAYEQRQSIRSQLLPKHRYWQKNGMAWRSYYMQLENFTLDNFNSLLRWIGEPAGEGGCSFTNITISNSGRKDSTDLPRNAQDPNEILNKSKCTFF